MAPLAHLVDQQAHRPGAVGDEHVGVAVVVDVAERGAAAHLRQRERGAGPLRHVLEPRAAAVTEHLVPLLQRERIVRSVHLQIQRDGPVDGDHVQPAVVVDVDPTRPEAGVRQTCGADAPARALVPEHPPVVDVQGAPLPRQLGDEEVLVTIVVEVAGVHPHVGLGHSGGAERRPPQQRAVPEGAVALVDPQLVLPLVVGDEQIEPAVVVVVGGSGAESRPELPPHPGLERHVRERPVAEIAVQPVRLSRTHLRRAVVRRSGRRIALPVRFLGVVQVVPDEQIEPAVAVVVEEGGGNAPPGTGGAGLGRDVGERPVPLVPVHLVGPEPRQVEVDRAVVVVVAGGHAHAVAARGDARLVRHVPEPQPALPAGPRLEIVAIQPVARRLPRGRRQEWIAVPEPSALHQVDVEVAVVVVVEQAHPGAHHLGLVEPAAHPVDVDEVEPRLRGAVDEPVAVVLDRQDRRCARSGGVGGSRRLRPAGGQPTGNSQCPHTQPAGPCVHRVMVDRPTRPAATSGPLARIVLILRSIESRRCRVALPPAHVQSFGGGAPAAHERTDPEKTAA